MTFEWGRTAGRAKVDGPRIFADEKHPRAFGAAMAMNRAYATRDLSQYCQWTLKRLKTGQSYIGICDGRADLDCQASFIRPASLLAFGRRRVRIATLE